MGKDEGNVFPGNWDVVSETLLRTYDLWFPQNWGPADLPWDECDAKNFSSDEGVAQAYWLSKLALFEKSGIGAFGAAAVQAATHQFEDPTKKFLSAVAFDECRHDEVCRRACARVCPNFPYRFKPKTELEEKAQRNIMALYDNGARYCRRVGPASSGRWNRGGLRSQRLMCCCSTPISRLPRVLWRRSLRRPSASVWHWCR